MAPKSHKWKKELERGFLILALVLHSASPVWLNVGSPREYALVQVFALPKI